MIPMRRLPARLLACVSWLAKMLVLLSCVILLAAFPLANVRAQRLRSGLCGAWCGFSAMRNWFLTFPSRRRSSRCLSGQWIFFRWLAHVATVTTSAWRWRHCWLRVASAVRSRRSRLIRAIRAASHTCTSWRTWPGAIFRLTPRMDGGLVGRSAMSTAKNACGGLTA